MSKLLKGGFAKSEEAEIVRFGLELAIMRTLISAAALIVAIALDSAPAVIAFMAVYQPLRSCCGGYHAKTRLACFISSILILLAVIAATKLLTDTVCLISSLCFTISGLNVIFFFAPVDTPTKPFDNTERIVFRKRSLIAAFFAILSADLFMLLGLDTLLLSVSMAVFFTGLLLVIGRTSNKKGAIA
jgi:accessory gene regulator B